MREEQLFHEVLEQAAEKRAAFLAAACGADVELRQRVEVLLRAQANPGSFLQCPAPGNRNSPTIDQPPVEMPGTQIGPYKLLQQIGEGGMGTVYMAEQTHPVQRQVALKVIKAGMDSRLVIARFEAERQALAMMDHVNIARVLDAGTTEAGLPYFVMELVHGIPITRYCDENHLTPRQRLELFVPVCQAIQHAHQKGIIHRDIKPSNVMVTLYDGKPVPKVIDFGVAKATEQRLTERTLFTQYGTMVGTLEYMSPEQAEMSALGIDTRSDIYSLGVLLYELLTGNTPLTHKRMKEAAYAEVLRMIREEEPPKPSTRLSDSGEALASISAQRHMEPAKLTKLVRGELDWIVMKTLEKDRNRRYETANGFAQDLERYLNDETVQACPPSAGYRFRKFARRNKAAIAVAGLVLFFLVLLGSGAGWAMRDRGAREQEAARDRSAREAEAAQQQAAREAKVAGQVELIFTEVDRLEREQKWAEALAAVRRAEAAVAGGEADAQTAERVRGLLKDLEFIDRLEQIRMQWATIVEGTFDYAGANRGYVRAFRDYGVDPMKLPVETSIDRLKARPALAIPLAATLDDWVHVQRRVSEIDPGWKWLVAVARGIDPEPLRDRLRSSWGQPFSEVQDELRRLAESIDIRMQHPATLVSLARTLTSTQTVDSALRLLRDAQYVHPGDFWLNFELGSALGTQKDNEGAIRYYTAAVSIRPNSAAAHSNLGIRLADQKKLDEAIACYRKAIDIDPKSRNAYISLGAALSAQEKHDEAIAAHHKAIELDPKFADAYINLGCALSGQKKLDEAIAAFHKAIELNPTSASAYYNLGIALRDQKKLDEAIAALNKAIELGPKYASAYFGLGQALRGQEKLDEAIAAYRKAIELDPEYTAAGAYINLGNILYRQNKPDEAIAAFRKAIEVNQPYATVTAHLQLGQAFSEQGKLDEAIAVYRKIIELKSDSPNTHNILAWILATRPEANLRDPKQAVALARRAIELKPEEGTFWNTLGAAQYRAGDYKEAIAALDKSMELRKGGDSKEWFFVAMAHWQLGEKDKAREWYDRAVEWMGKNQPTNEDLRRFHADAAELLGLPAPIDIATQMEAFHRRRTELDERNPKTNDVTDRWKLAGEYYQLSLQLRDFGKLTEAEGAARQSLEINQQLMKQDPQQIQYPYDAGFAADLLTDILQRAGRFEEALPICRDSLASFQLVAKVRPDSAVYLDPIVNVYRRLGDVLSRLDRKEEAAEASAQSAAVQQAAEELRKKKEPDEKRPEAELPQKPD